MPNGAIDPKSDASSFRQTEGRIRALELSVAGLDRSDPVALLQARSSVEADLTALEQLGRDVRAERSRLDTVDNILRSHASVLVRRADGTGGLATLRARFDPSEEHWWWWLDEAVAESRRREAKRFVFIVVAAAVVLLLVKVVLDRTGGTPEEKQAAVYSSQGQQRMVQGDNAGAIEAYELSIAVLEPQPDVWAALAVLYDIQGEPARATEAFVRTAELVAEPAAAEAVIARYYELVQDCESALTHAQLAVDADSSYANAYLARGSALECLDRWEEALNDYEHASELASAQGEDALYVLARTRMGMLMQMSGAAPAGDTGP
ncbi:MAG: tetratricopeptide repeat protein [Anaerolineae bacterium]